MECGFYFCCVVVPVGFFVVRGRSVLLGVSLKLLLVLIFMIIGRWSEDKYVLVFQVVRLARLEDMEVISGEVSCWVVCEGVRVCVF